MGSVQLHSNWAEIDLSAISDNVRFFCAHTDARVMAVVKANAYGHGAVPVAHTALKAGASWCGVAQAEEALAWSVRYCYWVLLRKQVWRS